jgi:hypothetical protein
MTPSSSCARNSPCSVFLAEVFSLHFFSTQPAPFKSRRYSSGAPSQGSSMNAEPARALDRSAPLNAFKTVAGFAKKKLQQQIPLARVDSNVE